ncbi:OadG family protein [Tepidibacter aestuarii]|uniref:OadG family protein n=1 Tax=Tepidibacter aestuarii TaxID=2925782 RepID=UPI0020BF6662|nr:OadG family protein [Tepidibacter aestuarii]CAH2214062.1 glutaconyl-CoA/methylmalonyl-CoA decarboxylase subunit delta [Tepidibacter aestuarii]
MDIIEALKVTFISMGIVFLSLYIISLILNLFKVLFYKEDKKSNSQIAVTSTKNDDLVDIKNLKDENDLVAALMASILASKNKDCKFRIKSIRRVV